MVPNPSHLSQSLSLITLNHSPVNGRLAGCDTTLAAHNAIIRRRIPVMCSVLAIMCDGRAMSDPVSDTATMTP
jgi:hypothetical protein